VLSSRGDFASTSVAMLAGALHILVGLLGSLLLYMSLFLTESEEGQIQNRLEELWVRIDDLSKSSLTKEAAFLQQASALLANGLDWLFGNKLLSAKAIATSLSLSGAATLLYLHNAQPLLPFPSVALIIGLVLVATSFAPGRLRYLGFMWIPLSALWFLIGALGEIIRGLQYFSFLAAFYGGALVSDVLFVAITRWLLRKISRQRETATLLTLLCSFVCLGILLAAPTLVALLIYYRRAFGAVSLGTGPVFVGVMVLLFVGASNSVSLLIVLLLFLLFLVVLLHRLIWPVLARPLYAAQRFRVFRSPKLLAGLAGLCLQFAWPQSRLVHFLAKLIHLPN